MTSYENELKHLEVLKKDTKDEELKVSIEKRIEILKERKTVQK